MQRFVFGALMLLTTASAVPALAQHEHSFIHLADLVVNPTRLEEFRLLTSKHVQTTMRQEVGVLAFYVVAEKEHPERVRFVEFYNDESAHLSHLQSTDFLNYRAAMAGMVMSTTSYDAMPIMLGAKKQLSMGDVRARVAEIEIDSAQLDAYKAAVSEEIRTSIRVEPGVLAIYAMYLKDKPANLRFFEIYADDEAYRNHIASAHFRKYVDVTESMITARNLLEMEPVALEVRAQ